MPNSILIVEDDDIQRRQIGRLLSAEGYRVSLAASGAEAIQMLGNKQVSIVLTDKKMPLMDGSELLVHIRRNYPHIFVIMVTAYPEDIENHEPDALLTKPFKGQELTELVRSFAEKGKT